MITVAWLVINAAGLLFALVDLWDGTLDVRMLETLGIHDSRAVAGRRNVRAQVARVLVLSIFIVAGIASYNEILRTVIPYLLVSSAAIVSLDAVFDRLARRKLIEQVRKERAALKRKHGHG